MNVILQFMIFINIIIYSFWEIMNIYVYKVEYYMIVYDGERVGNMLDSL